MEFKGDRLTDKMRRQNPFAVPDGYFDDLPSKIQNRISEKKVTKPSVGFLHLFKHQIGITFGVVFFAAVAYSGYKYNQYMDESVVQADDYYEYVTNNAGEFNEQEIIGVLESDKKTISKKAMKKESEKIIDYLLEQQVETSAVEDELYKN
jgi:hypothetical protein